MTELLFQRDAYLRVASATVTQTRDEGVVLDSTIFYPEGGGQPSDRGTLTSPGRDLIEIVSASKSADGVVLRIATGPSVLAPGDRVEQAIDWALRHAHMRGHTAVHLLSGATYRRFGAAITGSQIGPDRTRVDFTLPDARRELLEELVHEANAVVERDLPVSIRFVRREDAGRDPSLVRVAPGLMPDVEVYRIVDIGGYDVQADGGTHVAWTGEVGPLRLEKFENKGARNKRIYFSLGPGKPPRATHGAPLGGAALPV